MGGPYPKHGDIGVYGDTVRGKPLPNCIAEGYFVSSMGSQQYDVCLSHNSLNEGRGKEENTLYSLTADEIQPVAETLRRAFGVELFGFDVLVSCHPNDDNIYPSEHRREMFVVDVNYFPSYKEVKNFPSLLAQYLAKRAIEIDFNTGDYMD